MVGHGEDFVKTFFQRTIYNLDCYYQLNRHDNKNYPYEVTQLVNSFLGLIVFVNEDRRKIGDNFYDKVKGKIEIWTYTDKHNSKAFLRHLRNSIAHKGLSETVDEENTIIALTFEDKYRGNEFKITLFVEEIRELISEIKNEILSD